MRAGSAAKLIVDALLLRFLPLARRRIDTAQAQVGSSYHFHLSIVTTRYFTVRCCIHEDCFTQTKALCRIGFWDFLCCIQIWIHLFPFWGKVRILTAVWPAWNLVISYWKQLSFSTELTLYEDCVGWECWSEQRAGTYESCECGCRMGSIYEHQILPMSKCWTPWLWWPTIHLCLCWKLFLSGEKGDL